MKSKKITAKIINDKDYKNGLWVIVEGKKDGAAWAVTEDELEPIKEAIEEYLEKTPIERVYIEGKYRGMLEMLDNLFVSNKITIKLYTNLYEKISKKLHNYLSK